MLLISEFMFFHIHQYCSHLVKQFDRIPENRKEVLRKISKYLQEKTDQRKEIQLVYICTHNSRRSHFGQIWASVAAHFYELKHLQAFSGGTEETAFHPNAIQALRETGFQIDEPDENQINPKYRVNYGENLNLICFSKVYDHPTNPSDNFAAIMTCSEAEENCPFIPGVELRIATTYEDPKKFDGSPQQQTKYKERSEQIALETLYAFSLVHVH